MDQLSLAGVGLRLGIFVGVLLVMSSLEAIWPRRTRTQKRPGRWLTNMGLVLINSFALRFMGPIGAVFAAGLASINGWGLLNQFALPFYLNILISVMLLDLAVYAQHVISHKVPLFWRLHKVHHADRDVDATTGVRFHPVEAMLSMVYKSAIVLLLGPAALAVVVFEVVLNASAMFNHANLKLPKSLDKLLRTVFVTPDMHSVHHSVIPHETDSNYGFFLSIWDKLFGTYTAKPSLTPDKIHIGLNEYQTDNPSSLGWSLVLPFRAMNKS